MTGNPAADILAAENVSEYGINGVRSWFLLILGKTEI
jgi:hypothetical protein